MKYLKYLIILILVLGIAFIAKGMITPSISYETEIVVNKPVQESWAVMSDESNLPKWIRGFKKIEPVSGTPNTLGAVSKVYIEEEGTEMIMEETITALKENEHMAMSFTMDFMNIEYEMFFKDQGGKTVITTKTNTTGNSMIAKSRLSFMSSGMGKQEDKNLNNLKNLIEGN